MTRRQFTRYLALALLPVWLTARTEAAPITVGGTGKLIRLVEKGVRDADDWATDMHDVLRSHSLEINRENVCSVIAIIDQESGFVSNPVVPGLGRISEAALREKFESVPILGKLALNYLETYPTADTSFMKRIRSAKTERDLDVAYRELVTAASKSTSMGLVVQSGLFNKLIEDRNEIDTAGSMQVSVKFALNMAKRRRWLPMMLDDVYAVRDQLYTREGGMYYGVAQLLSYDTGYSSKVFRFADYNAGRYASRNASFQRIVSKLSGKQLALDGDLLLYGKNGLPLIRVSSTEDAIRQIDKQFKFGMSQKAIRSDLMKEKDQSFAGTATYIRLRDVFAQRSKAIPAFAEIPAIELSSPKISRKMTTKIFAETVYRRYRACMAAKI